MPSFHSNESLLSIPSFVSFVMSPDGVPVASQTRHSGMGTRAADRASISNAYADASRTVFIFCVAVIGIALLLTFFITDKGLKREEDVVEEKVREAEMGLENGPSAEKKPSLIARFITWRDSLVKDENNAGGNKCPPIPLQSRDRGEETAATASKSSLDSK